MNNTEGQPEQSIDLMIRGRSETVPAETNRQIEVVEAACLKLPQLDIPPNHQFAPGIYLREVTMPAGSFVIGHQHKTEHFCIAITGKARVAINGTVKEICAPSTFISKAGTRKMFFVLEEFKFATVHPTEETDIEKLEDALFEKSDAYMEYEGELKRLKGS